MTDEREIRVTLHNGTEVIMNTGDRVLFQASKLGAIPLAVDADTIVEDLIFTLDEVQNEADRINNHLLNACKDVEKLRNTLKDIKPYIQSLQADILNESKSYIHNAVNLILHKINTALEDNTKDK